jgi:hypothetical protein
MEYADNGDLATQIKLRRETGGLHRVWRNLWWITCALVNMVIEESSFIRSISKHLLKSIESVGGVADFFVHEVDVWNCLNLWLGYAQRMLRRERDNAHPSATGSGAVAYPQSENPAQGLDAWEKNNRVPAQQSSQVVFFGFGCFVVCLPWFLSLKLAEKSLVLSAAGIMGSSQLGRRPSGSR